MKKHRNPRARLPKRPSPDNFDPDLDNLIYLLRDSLGKADACITAAEELIERPEGSGGDEDVDEPSRRRNHVAHLIESAKLAVRAAAYTTEEIDRRRSEA
jgi:hypothetical protein